MSDKPREQIETGEIPTLRNPPREAPEKDRAADRSLSIFKSLLLAALLGITLYGMLNRGLFGLERWMPVVVSVLGLLFITLFVADYFANMPRVAWILTGLLAALVAVKGLSMTWTISQTDTVQELLRSSMYLAAFVLGAASLSSRRLVGPFVDGINLIAGAVAGYGVLQKVSPVEYPASTPGGVRIGSTLEYANTVAVVLGMGLALGLGRMTQLRNPVARGLYAALILVLAAILYFTFSRGGFVALGAGLVALFALGGRRLEMFGNLLLVSLPLGWLLWRAQDLTTFFTYVSEEAPRLADGAAFAVDLVIAMIAAFVLQAGYSALANRYDLAPQSRRALAVAAVAVVFLGAGTLGYLVASQQLVETGGVAGSFAQGLEEPDRANERLTSLSSNSRGKYWSVAWEAWKENPLTGTGAGTYHYTWLQDRPDFGGVQQVHNVYLEQGTETGILAFLALAGFTGLLLWHLARATWRASPDTEAARDGGDRKMLLAGLTAAAVVYLVSSGLEWHWYIPPSTIYFFLLAGVAVRFASDESGEDLPS